MAIQRLGRACCGCEACVNACPVNCIKMEEDEEGFRYPRVNNAVCKMCGTCDDVCPVINLQDLPPNQENPEVYAAWAKDEKVRLCSSSGGVFSVLGESVLDRGGAVAGAAWAEDLVAVEHVIIEDKNELERLRGSKYLQSHIGFAYKALGQLLKNRKEVLFVGTPCQVAGLRCYLGAEFTNLTTCDLVCHGVPSAKVFRNVVRFLEDQYGSKVVSVSFRDKRQGWKKYCVNIRLADGQEYARFFGRDPYMYGFLRNLFLRPSCHECPFARIPRIGDITLGDFWGVGSIDVNLDDDKGTSLILINTSKGKQFLERCSDGIYLTPCPLEPAINGNPCLVRPVEPSPDRGSFFAALGVQRFDRVMRKYMHPPNNVRRVLGKFRAGIRIIMKRWNYKASYQRLR